MDLTSKLSGVILFATLQFVLYTIFTKTPLSLYLCLSIICWSLTNFFLSSLSTWTRPLSFPESYCSPYFNSSYVQFFLYDSSSNSLLLFVRHLFTSYKPLFLILLCVNSTSKFSGNRSFTTPHFFLNLLFPLRMLLCVSLLVFVYHLFISRKPLFFFFFSTWTRPRSSPETYFSLHFNSSAGPRSIYFCLSTIYSRLANLFFCHPSRPRSSAETFTALHFLLYWVCPLQMVLCLSICLLSVFVSVCVFVFRQ